MPTLVLLMLSCSVCRWGFRCHLEVCDLHIHPARTRIQHRTQNAACAAPNTSDLICLAMYRLVACTPVDPITIHVGASPAELLIAPLQ